MSNNNFTKRIFVGITNNFDRSWHDKLEEIKKLKIKEAALFLEQVPTKKERREIYAALEKSGIERIPLVHVRGNMGQDELAYLCKKYHNP